jgi:hypothetical protein
MASQMRAAMCTSSFSPSSRICKRSRQLHRGSRVTNGGCQSTGPSMTEGCNGERAGLVAQRPGICRTMHSCRRTQTGCCGHQAVSSSLACQASHRHQVGQAVLGDERLLGGGHVWVVKELQHPPHRPGGGVPHAGVRVFECLWSQGVCGGSRGGLRFAC